MPSIRQSLVFALLLGLTGTASAQTAVKKSFDTQLFEPAIGTDTLLTVEPGTVTRHLNFGVDLMLNYQRKPLSIYTQELQGAGGSFDITNAEEVPVVENQMTADLAGAVGLRYRWLHAQVGLSLPINLVLTGNEVDHLGQKTGSLSATGLGDLRLQLKVALLRGWRGLSVAFSPIISFPTGNDEGFGGDPNLGLRPRFVADYRFGNFLVAANWGWIIRENTLAYGSEVGDQMLYGLGGSYKFHRRAVAMAELSGRAGFSTKSGCTVVAGQTVCAANSANDLDAFPLEMLLGSRVNIGRELHVTGGAGFGLVKGIGSPQFRLLVGLRWAPDFTDTDGDGIYDVDDQCPTQPEDRDGFQDEDGCPDPDNDGDGIPDYLDQCPDEPEDKDGFQDEDGCPDPDNDGDGIPDYLDQCPFEPETFNNFQDEDGCPDEPDADGDGVPDAVDKCPNEPEDRDGFEDEDGCPDPDNDGDGVPDQFDDCPNEPEDVDGFQDDDGCPDPDNDGDGVPDALDKCPNEPGPAPDGCPIKGKPSVQVTENKIVILKKVHFDTNRATIRRVSHGVLNEVALTMLMNKQIRGVRVEGHTDSSGDAERNRLLSQARAEAVRDYLIARGVDPSRLFAVGYGPEKPIEDNKTRRGREANRRVEFTILDQAPGESQ